jgi:hypothetical protein
LFPSKGQTKQSTMHLYRTKQLSCRALFGSKELSIFCIDGWNDFFPYKVLMTVVIGVLVGKAFSSTPIWQRWQSCE